MGIIIKNIVYFGKKVVYVNILALFAWANGKTYIKY